MFQGDGDARSSGKELIFVLFVSYLLEFTKDRSELPMGTIKFLNYWWIPDSVIDPNTATADYFKVTYDDLQRYIVVERYDAHNQLLSHDRFFWKENRLIRVDVYHPNGEMKKYILYQYGDEGQLLYRNHYSMDGKLLIHEPEEET